MNTPLLDISTRRPEPWTVTIDGTQYPLRSYHDMNAYDINRSDRLYAELAALERQVFATEQSSEEAAATEAHLRAAADAAVRQAFANGTTAPIDKLTDAMKIRIFRKFRECAIRDANEAVKTLDQAVRAIDAGDESRIQ